MITVFNQFISYLLLVIIFLCIIICAFMLGKKLRAAKDSKNVDSNVDSSKEEQ